MHVQNLRRMALLSALVILLTSCAFTAEAAKTYTGTITKDKIFFRPRPSTSGGYISRLMKDDKVTVTEMEGDFYKVKYNGKTGYVMCKFVKLSSSAVAALKKTYQAKAAKVTATAAKTTTKTTAKTTYVTRELKWFSGGRKAIPRNAVFTIKDVKTGKTWTCKAMYGTNHLDAEPLTKADTKKMKAVYGGRINYKRRPVLILYKDKVYAGSMYGVPHGDQTITDNDFDGQFCIHFTGSKTHGSNKVDADHQAAIKVALKATW